MAPPTRGHCDGVVAFKVKEGYFGDVPMEGLIFAATYYFPRAIHHGGGHMQPIVHEDSTEAQREGLFAIMSGEGQPVGTIFNIFSVIVEHIHEPLFLPLQFDWDIKKRTCLVNVPGVVRAETTPIRNPVTDDEILLRTVLPKGWVFYEAEVGSGTAKGFGDIKFDYSQRHSSLAYFAFDNDGMAYNYGESLERYGLDKIA